MKRLIRRRPRAGTIIAIVALIAALAGTAVAAGPFLPKRKFSNFKKNVAVKGPITYANQTQSVNTTNDPPTANGVTITANCPSGFTPVGGGVKSATPTGQSELIVLQDYPSATGWTATVLAGFGPAPGTAEQITVTAICERGPTSGSPPAVTS
jgi:hypothetical protein